MHSSEWESEKERLQLHRAGFVPKADCYQLTGFAKWGKHISWAARVLGRGRMGNLCSSGETQAEQLTGTKQNEKVARYQKYVFSQNKSDQLYSAIWKEGVICKIRTISALAGPVDFQWLPEHPVLGSSSRKAAAAAVPGCDAVIAGVAASGDLVIASLRRVLLRVLWTLWSHRQTVPSLGERWGGVCVASLSSPVRMRCLGWDLLSLPAPPFYCL